MDRETGGKGVKGHAAFVSNHHLYTQIAYLLTHFPQPHALSPPVKYHGSQGVAGLSTL